MKIAYAIFYTRNIQQIKDFYSEVLALEVDHESEDFIAFKLDQGLLGIKLSTESREIPGSQTVILTTEDARNLEGKLKDSDVPFYKELGDEGWGLNFAIIDPDGNKVELVEE